MHTAALYISKKVVYVSLLGIDHHIQNHKTLLIIKSKGKLSIKSAFNGAGGFKLVNDQIHISN